MDKNIKFQHFVLTQTERAQIKNQTPMCLWMTGLSGAGKTTLANALEQELNKKDLEQYLNMIEEAEKKRSQKTR